MFFIKFYILSYPHSTTHYQNHWIHQTTCQAKPVKCIIKLYAGHNILWVYPSKSFKDRFFFKVRQHGRSTTTLSSVQSMLDSLQNGRCSFIFTTLLAHVTSRTISTKIYFSTSVNFHLLFQLYLFTKSSLQSPLTLNSSIPQ